ncbi:MAG: hypothetical protein AABO41_23895 [Acidobacteriota bacterium]
MSAFLFLAGAAESRAQAIAPTEPASENSSATTQPNDRLAAQQNERIISLIDQLADQARQAEDMIFAVRAQSQAATLIWPYDPERARAIYRRAFHSLTAAAPSRLNEKTNSNEKPNTNLAPAERLQLRSELLNQIAGRDSELADELARTLAETAGSKDGCSPPFACDQLVPVQPPASGSSRDETERREMLISVALRIVEREPQQAMALAQMSLALGLSQNFSRLLLLMRSSEPGLADLLFSSAVARLERASAVDLSDIHTLGSYLVSAGSSAREAMGRALVTRFLNLAFNQIERCSNSAAAGLGRAARRDESAAVYFVGRQLTDLFARYQPDRLEQLQRNISDLTEPAPDSVIELASYQASGPAEMEAAALSIGDSRERDALYARAALAWLGKDELRRAQSAAFAIEDSEMRDRVLGQLVRKHSVEGRIDEAVALARRMQDGSSRVESLVVLASSALASKNRARAIEILNEAESTSAKLRAPAARMFSLLKVAATVSGFDALRGFEMMQSVVKAINEAGNQQREPKQTGSAKTPASNDLPTSTSAESYTPALEGTLVVLARADFERALLLAQQIEAKEAAVAAQLAVCRGALTAKPPSSLSTTADDVEASANPLR